MSIRAIDLFCGAGGSSWGAREAGIDVIAAFDLWTLAGEVYKKNFPEAEFIPGRLEEHDVSKMAKRFDSIDMLLASPECTNHSPAKGNKPRCEQSKDSAFQVIRFIEVFNPRWVVIENVTNMRKWSRYIEFKSALDEHGYKICEQVLNSMHFGVPQSRNRLFLTAEKNRKPPEISLPKIKVKTIAKALDLNGRFNWTPLRQLGRAEATLRRAENGLHALGENKPFLIVYYGSDGGGGWQPLDRPLRTITTLDRFALVKPDPMYGHVMRMLQVPELQAAMGMPPKMKFECGTRRDCVKMIGNAVCPPVMREVIKQLVSKVD